MEKYNDYPIEEVIANMNRLINQGATCFVKFTCIHCGARQTSDEPNTFHAAGYYCEECGGLTIPKKINFMMIREKI